MTETSRTVASPASPARLPDDPLPDVPVLDQPADGVPPVVTTDAALAETIRQLQAGSGPVAVDAERAHGFRYSQRAYLIQLRRAGAGTHLVDPIAFSEVADGLVVRAADLRKLGAAIADAEWIIHAASQDLACLREVGLTPRTLFDTELAARLLGYPRVALGTMLEELLGVRLRKEHSAADWSTRPLPADWLTYAALDVELLIELRDRLAAQLAETGKAAWAEQEFAALAAGPDVAPEPRPDPWRRTSGIHKIRTRRGLAYVAELWYARDAIAERIDRAPGRVLADLGITELAAGEQPGRAALRRIPSFHRRQARALESEWLSAVDRAAALRDADLPPMHVPSEGPPQPRLWAARDPEAADRLTRMRSVLAEISAEVGVPVENLLTPDFVRRIAWRPPNPISAESLDLAFRVLGARDWQRELTVPGLATALQE